MDHYSDAAAWSPEELDQAVDAYLGRSESRPGPAPTLNLASTAAPRSSAAASQPAAPPAPPAAAAGGDIEGMVDSILTPAGGTPSAYSAPSAARGRQPSTAAAASQPFDNDALVGATPLGALAEGDIPYVTEGRGSHSHDGSADGYEQPDFRGSSERGSSRSASTQSALRVDTQLMIRRMAMWKARKERSLAAKRQEAAAKELEPCTFQPLVAEDVQRRLHSPDRLLGPSSLYRDNRAWGTDEFLQRQERARKLKEEKKQHEQEVFSSGSRWQHRTTVPRPFAIGTHRHRTQDALAAGGAPHGGGMTSVGAGSSRAMAKTIAKLRTHFDAEPSRIEAPSVPPGAFSAARPGRAPPRGGSYDDHWNAQLDQMVSDML
eukprot:CAMPEP_0174837506 /NCGR_PEP_ID=MMETSP1114-20130205/6792_1 /TAXON_ID=312471 /ORGANISM="Neobodo designis, Strain CCAP 1951/1" /LENGTH=375 /DNA_ID=CAMNT_0016071573 /DNA_START=57 /DNA_END=1184 /DNA_ORIENTATION=+